MKISIGFPAALALTFIILKLLHKIDWSWWWVLAPLWVGLGFVLFVLLCAALVTILAKD